MSGAIHICLSGNLTCSGILPCAECHGARSQVLARAFVMAGFTDRAQMQHFFQTYAAVWQQFQAEVFAAVPQVPPTLNGADPGGAATMPAPEMPESPPVGMTAAPSEAKLEEAPVVAEPEERDIMAPMTQTELESMFARAQKPLPVEGGEVAVASPPAPEKTPGKDRESGRDVAREARQEEGTT